MIEVFKTDVTDPAHADLLIERIHRAFTDHRANFDLEDCDNILRVKCINGPVHLSGLMRLLTEQGVQAEVLPD